MTTLLSALGGSVSVDPDEGEVLIGALGDGTAKAGWACGINATTGQVFGVNPTGNLDEFVGFLKEHPTIDLDTAITANLPCSLIVPKGGKRYRALIKDPASTIIAGEPMNWIAGTAGALDKVGDIESQHVARLSKGAVSGDTFAEIVWGS